jgi:hypothetical protein
MVLTEFVKLPRVQEKFNAYFNPSFNNKFKPKYLTKSPSGGGVPKPNIGIYYEFIDGKIGFICDNNRRWNEVTSVEGLLIFFTHMRYRNGLCWFYDPFFNFKTIMSDLPDQEFTELDTTGKTEYLGYTIQYKEKNFFQINKKHNNYYKFYNLHPFFNSSLDDAAKKHLNYSAVELQTDKTLKKDKSYCKQHPDLNTESCFEKASIIQRLACHSINNNFDQNRIADKKIINVPRTTNYQLVGIAFEYLLRVLIKAHSPKSITSSWRVERSLDILEGKEKKLAKSIIKTAKKRYDLFLREKEINDEIIISSLQLGKVEGVVWGTSFDDIDLTVNPADIEDMRNLIDGVPKSLYIGKESCFLNPTFGLASILVGGADADLCIDNTLIDIKTTKNPKFTPQFFNQLMGYVILHELGQLYSNNTKKIDPNGIDEAVYGKDTDKAFLNIKIEKIGIYFSRFNHLFTIDLKDVLPNGDIDSDILKWFEQEAHKEYNPKILDIQKMRKFFK